MIDLITILFVLLGVGALALIVRGVDLFIARVFGEGSTKEQNDQIAMECEAYVDLARAEACRKQDASVTSACVFVDALVSVRELL